MAAREDRLRIDGTGQVHPLGKDASAELRKREGEWRLLPAPEEVLLAKPVAGGRVVRLAGEVRQPGVLSDVLAIAAQAGVKGELCVYSSTGNRSLFLEGGNVVAVVTSVALERLGELLYRFGVVPDRADLAALLKSSEDSGKRLGEVAIELGFVTAEDMFGMMRRQIEEVVFAALQEGDAMFCLLEGFDEANIRGRRFAVAAMSLLMECAQRTDELRFFRERIPSSGHIPQRVEPGDGSIGGAPYSMRTSMPPDELREMYFACDGRTSIEELGRQFGLLEFETTKSIYQLLSGGFLRVLPPRPKGAEDIVEAFNPALVAIHRACEEVGKLAELRNGLSRYATGSGVYDALFMMAGPDETGALKADRVAGNLGALAGADPDTWLMQLMNDYISFALFHAESLMTRPTHEKLAAKISAELEALRGGADRK